MINPVEYLYDSLHQNTFVYFSVLKEVLLNRVDVLEKVVFVDEELPGQYKSTCSNQYFKENLLLGCQSNCISVGVYIDDFEIYNRLGTS